MVIKFDDHVTSQWSLDKMKSCLDFSLHNNVSWLLTSEISRNNFYLSYISLAISLVCRVTQRGQMHVRHLRELATKISGLQQENSDLAKNLECKIQNLCKSIFRDCCIELEHLSDKIERAASSINHIDYLEMNGALTKDVALIYKRICSSATGVPQFIIENFLSVVPQLIQTMKEVYVHEEISQVQNGLRGLPDKDLEQFVSNVRYAERKNKVWPLVGQMCKVLEDLCLQNCGKKSTAEIEKWANGLALLSMLEFLKPFFQQCPQDIRLHTRLELFSCNLRNIMLGLMDVAEEAFVRDLSDVVLSLIAFAKFEPLKLVRFELFDITGALLDCNAIENLKYDRHHDSYSQHFYIRNESDGELQVHALACVLIDGLICKIGAFQSVVFLRPSGEPVFDKCMTRFCGVAVARQKDKDSENFRMVLCSTQKEKLSDALDVLRGELSEDLIDFKKSVITPCHLTMRSVPGKKNAVLSLRLVYKWGSDAVSLDSSDFLPFADSTADGTWIPELQVKGNNFFIISKGQWCTFIDICCRRT